MSKLNRFPAYLLAGLLLISASACDGLTVSLTVNRELESNLNISAIQEIEETLDGLSQNAPAYDRNHDFYSSSLQELSDLKTAYSDLKQDLPDQLNDAVSTFELLSSGKSRQMRSPGGEASDLIEQAQQKEGLKVPSAHLSIREASDLIEQAQQKLDLDLRDRDGQDGPGTFKAAMALRERVIENVRSSLEELKPKVIVSPTGLEVDEARGTQTYMVKLDTKPSSNVRVEPNIEDPTVASTSPTDLTFTPDNWNNAQEITVTGKDDDQVNDPNRTATISHNVSGGYSAIVSKPPGVTVTAIDDDGEANNRTRSDNQEGGSSSLGTPAESVEVADGTSTSPRPSLLESIWFPFGILLFFQLLGCWIIYQSLREVERKIWVISNRQLPQLPKNRDMLAEISKELRSNRGEKEIAYDTGRSNYDRDLDQIIHQVVRSVLQEISPPEPSRRSPANPQPNVDTLVELFNQLPQEFSRSLRGQGLNHCSVAQTTESFDYTQRNFGEGDFILEQSSATDFWIVEIGSSYFLFPSDNYIAEAWRRAIPSLFETTPSRLSTRKAFVLIKPAKVSVTGSNSWQLVEKGKLSEYKGQDVAVDKVSENELVELFNQSPQEFGEVLRKQRLKYYSVAQTLESYINMGKNMGQGDLILAKSKTIDFWIVEIEGPSFLLFPSQNYITSVLKPAISASFEATPTPSRLSIRNPFILIRPAKVSATDDNSWKIDQKGRLIQ